MGKVNRNAPKELSKPVERKVRRRYINAASWNLKHVSAIAKTVACAALAKAVGIARAFDVHDPNEQLQPIYDATNHTIDPATAIGIGGATALLAIGTLACASVAFLAYVRCKSESGDARDTRELFLRSRLELREWTQITP
jgi:hypothetical protein